MKEYAKAKRLVNAVEEGGILLVDFSLQTPEKRRILSQVCSYKYLRTGPDDSEKTWTVVSECDALQINSVLRDKYSSAKKLIAKQESHNPAPRREKDICSVLELGQRNLFDVKSGVEPSRKELDFFRQHMIYMAEDGVDPFALKYLDKIEILKMAFGKTCLDSYNPNSVNETFRNLYKKSFR